MKYQNIYKYRVDEPNFFHMHYGANKIEGDDREFKLHLHSFPEIYIYLGGKAKFFMAGTTFRLNPYDIILVPPNILHQPQPSLNEFFERIVVNIQPDFFDFMHCHEYKDVFDNLSDFKYKIPGYMVKRSGITAFINFVCDEYKPNSRYMNPRLICKIMDLLYMLNTVEKFEGCDDVNEVVQNLINYIDENYKSIYDLESIASHFPYSKNHLGHLFKKHTGITITKYMNLKKLENVELLCQQGKSLTYACIESGFTSYDSFSYFYKKELGVSPRKGLLAVHEKTITI